MDSQIRQVESYIFKYAPKYVHDLLAEFRLPQLDRSAFQNCYNGMKNSIYERDDDTEPLYDAARYAFSFSVKSSFMWQDLLGRYFDDFQKLLIDECEEWGPLLPFGVEDD